MSDQPGPPPTAPPPAAPAAAAPPRQEGTFDRRFFIRLAVQSAVVMLALIAGVAVLGLGQRFGWWAAGGPATVTTDSATGVIFTCPMHPQIRQTAPGNCPICGMKLEPLGSAGLDIDELAVTIPPAARRLANIATATVERRPIDRTVETVGSIAIDESRQATIAAYVDGRLEKLYADYTGVQVAKGDHLAVLYSPSLYEQQSKYVEFRKRLGGPEGTTLPAVKESWEEMVVNLRQRLVELGMTDEQLAELDESNKPKLRQTIYAPIGGTVIEKLTVEGQYVTAGEPIYRIANLGTVWLMLELYPEDAALVRFGQRVESEVQSLPGRKYTGRVAFVDPVVDPQTRTVGVRVELLNGDGRLRPGDLATAHIEVPIGATGDVYDSDLAGKWISPMHPQIIQDAPGQCPICGMDLVPTSRFGFSGEPVAQPQVLVVPRDAVLMAGQNSVVYVETEPGRFEIRPVQLGAVAGRSAVILSGLKEGEQVATSGNFLIDSQMQLAGRPSLIDPTRAIAKSEQPKTGPLHAAKIDVQPLAGPAGERLEALYRAYADVQSQLASDQKVTEPQALAVRQAAGDVLQTENLPADVREHVQAISDNAEHLHHLDVTAAREHFRTISRHVTQLAFEYRGDQAEGPLLHFYCPMVKDGGADWLQTGGELRNPYFGASMLRCGELVHTLPPRGPAAEPSKDDKSNL